MTFQEEEVADVKYIDWKAYREILKNGDPAYVPYEVDGDYGQLFKAIEKRFVFCGSKELRDGRRSTYT
jgi:hypothetical protein